MFVSPRNGILLCEMANKIIIFMVPICITLSGTLWAPQIRCVIGLIVCISPKTMRSSDWEKRLKSCYTLYLFHLLICLGQLSVQLLAL